MTPRERLYARMAGEAVDRIPNLNIVMMFAAQYTGALYGDFCRDYRVLVDSQLRTAEEFQIDILSTMSDPFRETCDFGIPLTYPKDDLPRKTCNLLEEPEEIAEKIHLWDPMCSDRILDRVHAVALFRKLRGQQFPVLGWIEGPWAEFTDLADISDAMFMLLDDPEAVCAGMDIIMEQEIRCAQAQIDAGADIIGMGDAAASLISAELYRSLVLPREKRIISEIHRAGAKVKLHICGNINHILGDMVTSGADIVDIDYMVNLKDAAALAGDRCSICGNINPTAVILQGTAEENRQAVRECVRMGNNRSIVSSGCEIPRLTPLKNVYAISEELKALARQ